MTDDLTQRHETNPAGDAPAQTGETLPAADAAATDAAATDAATSGAATSGAGTSDAVPPLATDPGAAAPVAAVAPARASRGKWLAALGIAGVAIVAGIAALLLVGKPSTPEALTYVPGDAAFVVELRPELPGDQMQALGNLLSHFPGFKDQSTLPQKIDEALKRIIAQTPGSSVDYEKDVKPFLSGPIFVSVRSFEGMATSDTPTNFAVVATTTGTVTCATTFGGEPITTESYNGLQLSIASDTGRACAIDGRFAILGDPAGVKSAIDTRKGATGLDKSTRYQAARTQLGLDRLVTFYVDGTSLAKAVPSSDPGLPMGDLAGVVPDWVMGGVRAENDALVMDVVVAAPPNASAAPSMRSYPPVHPLALTAFAPADTLVFAEAQGAGVSLLNFADQLKGAPQFSDALKQLETFGGIDGLIDWIDDIGVVVLRQGDAPAGAVILAAKDAASASEKVTALETVLALGALGGDIDVSTTTVEGVKVTTINIPDAGALTGGVTGGQPVPLTLSIAAKDQFVILGIGQDVMSKLLAPKAGTGLADDAAFKRALARGSANPQVVIYVAAGATIDWVDSAAPALGGTALPADVKAYLDPLEGFIYTVVGNGLNGSFRIALTVTTP